MAIGIPKEMTAPSERIHLEAEVAVLRRQLLQATVENSRKDSVIASLKRRLEEHKDHGELTSCKQRINPLSSLGDALLTMPKSEGTQDGAKPVRDVVDDIQRWLFLEGGNLRDVESLLTSYCELCRKIGVPLDRLFVAGMMMHPHTSAYVWKWELGQTFNEHEVPPEAFQVPNYNPNEPFAVLLEGRAMDYRMNSDTKEIPPGCDWFTEGGYQDYYALPMYHNGKFKGALAWCTKCSRHFSNEHLEIFEKSLTALSTVLRLYSNDLVVDKAMYKLEEAVKSQTSKLAAANTSLEEANRKIIDQAQKQLRHFAMMSHEIRTPLNCIVGISNLMVDSCDDAEMKESIEMITGSGDLLLAIVDDVLDYSKLAAGEVVTRIGQTNLGRTIKAVQTSIGTKARMIGLELRTSFSLNLPEFIETDGRRLQQILYNLLGNAVKFGSKGEYVDFSIELVRDGTNNKYVKFAVKDYGKGIAPSEVAKVFEPFKQLASNEANHGGTGLGLAITRQLVKALDGTISVQSDFGRWCEFTVNLPCKFKTISPLLDSSTTPQSSNRKILVTECTHPTGLVLSSEDDLFDSDDSYTSSTSCTVLSSMSFQHILDASKRKNEAPCKPSIQTETVDVPNAHFGRIKIGDGSTTTSESVPKLNQKDINTQAPEYLPKANQEKSISTSSTEPRSFEQLRVLVAEDNLINQKVLRKALTRVGVKNIETVDNGQKAVEASEKNIFDIIFMDMQMPIMDGLEATSIISKRVDRPKIVFLTAHALREFQEKAVEAGGDGFISKPFKLGMIRETLDGLLIKRDTDIYDE